MRRIGWLACAVLIFGAALRAERDAPEKLSPIERYIEEALAQAATQQPPPGSLYTAGALLGDIGRDLRASRINDIVTIVVSDRASAVSSGAINTGRSSAANSSILSLFGAVASGGSLANLANLSGEQELQGQGQTSRTTVLTTTISARVTHVLPNGYLVVEGLKDIWINSERQQVAIRGVVRWNDLDGGNRVSSDRLANLEVRVNGKGVVGDAIRRPNFFYRLLLGLLPF
jgi:flagellar L-ring protein precursor FlgH